MTVNISDAKITILEWATTRRNSANPSATPMTLEEFVEDIVLVKAEQFELEKDALERAELAANLIALGKLAASNLDKLDQIEEAIINIVEG